MSLRTLHLCNSDAWGGLELYACTLMAELAKAGIGVLAICRPRSKAASFLTERGVEVLHLPNSRRISPAGIGYLRRLVAERGIDAVHVHYHSDVWLASLALRSDPVRRLILSIYMGVPPKRDPIHRFIYARVDSIITSSADLSSRLPDLYAVPRSRVFLVPYGRVLEEYRRDESRRSSIRELQGVGPADILVGTMLRIDPGKGVMDFAESFLYIDPVLRSRVTYMIVGEPTRKGRAATRGSPFEERCEAYLRSIQTFIAAQGLTQQVRMVGYQDDRIGYLSAMDAFVFPSRDELFSLVVLDAMGMELPVIAAAAGGNVAQVEDGATGLLYNVADSRDLASKISRCLSEPGLGRRLGQSARARVEEVHDMKKTIGRLVEIYSNRRSNPRSSPGRAAPVAGEE